MKLQQAQRHQAKMKMGIQGASGSGKTYGSLLMAQGMVDGDWSKIVVIDTENGSSHLYSSLGTFYVIQLESPFTPEKYIEALHFVSQKGMECVVVDSISPEWEYLVGFHASLPGASFNNWAKVTPRHTAFVQAVLSIDAHTIVTMRSKQDFVINLRDGKHVPEKVGLKAIQRDGIEYELTLCFDLNQSHLCSVSKDRTGLFADKPEYRSFKITPEHGALIKDWTDGGTDIRSFIMHCKTIDELRSLYDKTRPTSQEVLELFSLQKRILHTKMMSNGTTTNS